MLDLVLDDEGDDMDAGERQALHDAISDPDSLQEPRVSIASLLDLAATKAEVVQARAAAKDYLDVDALIDRAGSP